MAATAASMEYVQKMFLAYFGRPVAPTGQEYYATLVDEGNIAALQDDFWNSAESQNKFAGLSTEAKVKAIFQQLFARDPAMEGLTYWTTKINSGEVSLPVAALTILNGAAEADLEVFNAKLAVAEAFTAALDTAEKVVAYQASLDAAVSLLAAVTDAEEAEGVIENIDEAVAEVIGSGGGANPGQTFTLTENVDSGAAFTGGAGDDLFIASDITLGGGATKATWTAGDALDGGAGYNTLQVISSQAITKPAGATIKNIQKLDLTAADTTINVDATGFTGLETVVANTLGNKAQTLKVGADVNVTSNITEAAGAAVAITGGNDVSVAATKVGAGSDIGVTDATGDVVVNVTGKAYENAANTLGDITINGGKTISVTQVATSDASKATKGESVDNTSGGKDVTQGDVTITADETTTSVTVKQDAQQTARDQVKAEAGKTEVATVTFKAVAVNEVVTVGGLKFTANKNLSANQVAQAFANLSATAIKPGAADGDTQGSGIHENGVFEGSLALSQAAGAGVNKATQWSSAAAQGATVTFTANGIGGVTDLVASSSVGANAPVVVVTTDGENSVTGSTGQMGIDVGDVDITGGAALETVTVDGYAGGAGNGIGGNTNNALATVDLKNGQGAFTITSAAATLDLSVDNKADTTVAVTKGTETLNADVAENRKVNGDLYVTTLESNSVKTLNLTGAGGVEGDGVTGLKVIETIDASEFTGEAAFSLDASRTAYIGGAAKEFVELVKPADVTKISQNIDLGAGDDTLDMSGFDGGDVQQLKAGLVFDGGEGNDTLILGAVAAETISGIAFDAKNFLEKVTGFENLQIDDLDGAARTINMGNLAGFDTLTVNDLDSQNLTIRDAAQGFTLAVAGTGAVTELKFKGFTGTKVASDANVVIQVGADLDIGTVKADNLDTLNITSNTVDKVAGKVHTVEVSGQYISNIVIGGDNGAVSATGTSGGVELKLASGNIGTLAEVDASGLTVGGLTLNLGAAGTGNSIVGEAVTVTGGQGRDTLTASNDKADELYGGAGNDTLVAGATGSILSGGTGNDLFVINTKGNAVDAANNTISYSTIVDFKNGDNLLQLVQADGTTLVTDLVAATGIDQSATLLANANAAIKSAAHGEAAWFVYQGSTYIVVDNEDDNASEGSDNFTTNVDAIIRIAGVNFNDGYSFNSDFGTVALV